MNSRTRLVLPTSENEFLTDLLFSVKKRSKSLKYNSWAINVERIFEEYDSGRVEKLEIKLKPADYNAWLEVEIWEDRWVTVNCWERTKQNSWDWFYSGKLLGNIECRAFISSIEATNARFFQMTTENLDSFNSIWEPLLANSPKLVRG
jgi:hypothetical protein